MAEPGGAKSKDLRVGIAGLGLAGTSMLSAFVRHPHISVVAAARPDGRGLDQFARDFEAETFRTVEELCGSDSIDAVYIATPTELHAEHAMIAAKAGKHILLEKPMAATLEDAQMIVDTAKRCGVTLLVGHSHSYDPPVREIADIVASGRVGDLAMINSWFYSDWFYRPRRPDELDSSRGGGVTLRQGAHQFDIIRHIGGGLVRSVRASTGSWDPARPGQGSHVAFLTFENGAVATAVYSGYDHFPSSELTFGVTEGGTIARPDGYGLARERSGRTDEVVAKSEVGYPDAGKQFERQQHQPFFGLTIVSCTRGDIRQSPDGIIVYGDGGREEVPLSSTETPRDAVVHEFYDAISANSAAIHDGRWGIATLEVCLAVLESARTEAEVSLSYQVASVR